MTTQELLQIVTNRGLRLSLKDGGPVISGAKEEITGPLLLCLKRHRERIIEILRSQQPAEQKKEPFRQPVRSVAPTLFDQEDSAYDHRA